MQNIVLVFWYVVGTAVINNMLKIHDNIPHIKGVIATRVKHKCSGKLEVFIAAGGGRWRCSRLSPICPRAPTMLTQLLSAVSYCACLTQPDMRSGQCTVSARHRPAGTPKQNVWSGFTLVSQPVSCCHAGKCSLVFSKDLLTKYIVLYASNLSGYLTHVVEWTGAIWPCSSLRAAVVVPRILQAEKLDSCQINHGEYLPTLTLCPAQ